MEERIKGRPVSMRLAGGKIITRAMAQYGEVMPPPPDHGDGVGWILPVQRVVKELGMEMVWTQNHICLKHPDGKEIPLMLDQGLQMLYNFGML